MRLKFRIVQVIGADYEPYEPGEILTPRVTDEGSIVLDSENGRSHYIDEGFGCHELNGEFGDRPLPTLEQWTGEYDDDGNEIYVRVTK